jgi:cell division GTPase FtsZ
MKEMTEFLGSNANVIFGARIDDEYRDQIKIMSIINGVEINNTGLPAVEISPEMPAFNPTVPMVQ